MDDSNSKEKDDILVVGDVQEDDGADEATECEVVVGAGELAQEGRKKGKKGNKPCFVCQKVAIIMCMYRI